ncbi:MAG: thioredoxin family protein [Capnocytophaga sp.]|nr:thioredoxin family protein [Capnocytophaga sp.]
METKQIIEESLLRSISYETYRSLISQLVAEGRSSGPVQSDELIAYTAINEKRMNRLDKIIKIQEDKAEFFANYKKKVTFLVITESWCGDAAQIVPVINKISQLSPIINTKIVFRDENEALMNLYLTNGGKAIPIVVILDGENNVITHWGSRPSTATRMVEDYKAKHGKLTPEFKEDLQKWYNQDKGVTIIDDFLKILF